MIQRHGFTLVELSIVLVILGLLVGGVLTGQSLIRAAELRSVASQYSRYQAAVMTFRDKYFALPGDMTNATSYWGTETSCPSTASTTTATCNGNGDGQILTSTNSVENFRFWQHLANAGLIEGNYIGVAVSGPFVNSTNVPPGRINGSFWYVTYTASYTGSTNGVFDGQYGNWLEFGAAHTGADPADPIFKPEDAYNIDLKLDEGKPATGKIVMRAQNGMALCADSTSTSNMNANYLLSGTTVGCSLIFRQQF